MKRREHAAIESLISYLFGGSIFLYTANANLTLLSQTYPEPQFIGFGLFALEGGIVAWFLLYKLSSSGTHKGLALFNVVVCSLFSLVGFLVETLHVTGQIGPVGVPPVAYVVVGAVAWNAIMSIVYKLKPHDDQAQVRYEEPADYQEEQPGVVSRFLSATVGPLLDKGEERLAARKSRTEVVALTNEETEPPQTPRGPGRPKKQLPPLVLKETSPDAAQQMNNTGGTQHS